MRTRPFSRLRGTLTAAVAVAFSLSAASLAAADTSPSHAPAARAAKAADIRGHEIINRSDGSRMGIWSDQDFDGAWSATHRGVGYEERKTMTWRFEDQGDGTWQIRNETVDKLCLATERAPAVGVRVIMKTCDTGNPAQSWRMVAEQTEPASEDPGGTTTGWWSLRPADSTKYAAAPQAIGAVHSEILLYRATNSADRLWHHARPWQSW
ncbi:RICIN domain-containing protein [Streptomyces sp. NPDC048436]|uniref:RICIN domain-containing protein n=1 Tax=Streptomyces sp. NPDC048436 TaxID=3365550 RepID=UPI0037105C02